MIHPPAPQLQRPPTRRRLVLAAWILSMGIIAVRAGHVQVVQASEWRRVAGSQHQSDVEVPAPRGAILDRDGTPLAVSRERYRIEFASRELSDVGQMRELLVEELGLSRRQAERLTAGSRSWSVVPGLHTPSVREHFRDVRGVRFERELERYYPHGDLARGLLGHVQEESGQGGVEQAFEDRLSGIAGREVIARDNLGRPLPGERLVAEPPRPGEDVVLTLDLDLQEIAAEALEEAIERTGATGGDVLITDPKTGEILALVSVRDGESAALSAIHTPFEPGSTLKPFTIAGILKHGIGSLEDTVDVGNGSWEVAGRTLHDVHAEGRMSLEDALRVSSNVGIAKAAAPLSVGAQYENLRDFGFGLPTGVELPGESGGILRRPDRWTPQSPASLAIGYEISVTPLQMAMAYGALANGGLLMEPHLVREVRGADGAVLRRTEPKVVRRVVPGDVARTVARALVGVVEDGTGTSARMATFQVAGKSGTTRAYSDHGYEQGAYYSSFIGFFPAESPQLVVFVKLERPQGAYYGGAIAAPVTRATMEAALAVRQTPLDRAALLRSASREARPEASPEAARFANHPIDLPGLPAEADANEEEWVAAGSLPEGVSLPDVSGLPNRVAVRRLHALGLRVELSGSGEILGTVPSAGSRVLPGDTIRLRIGRRGGHG